MSQALRTGGRILRQHVQTHLAPRSRYFPRPMVRQKLLLLSERSEAVSRLQNVSSDASIFDHDFHA